MSRSHFARTAASLYVLGGRSSALSAGRTGMGRVWMPDRHFVIRDMHPRLVLLRYLAGMLPVRVREGCTQADRRAALRRLALERAWRLGNRAPESCQAMS